MPQVSCEATPPTDGKECLTFGVLTSSAVLTNTGSSCRSKTETEGCGIASAEAMPTGRKPRKSVMVAFWPVRLTEADVQLTWVATLTVAGWPDSTLSRRHMRA